jgi:hypothetical protein
MRMSASWFGSSTHRIQGRGVIDPRPKSGLPSDRHPARTKRAVVLEAVKVWPGKGGVRRKVEAAANLDSSCERRLCNIAGRGEETGLQVEQDVDPTGLRRATPLLLFQHFPGQFPRIALFFALLFEVRKNAIVATCIRGICISYQQAATKGVTHPFMIFVGILYASHAQSADA